MIVIKKGIILLLTLLMLAFGVEQVIAQPMVFGPQEIIDKSELIIVGTVTKSYSGVKQRSVTLIVDGVLKGYYNKKELTLTKTKPADGNWLDFNFPKEGQQVFLPLIMSSATEYEFMSDLFNVGLIKDGKVKLFNPSNISSETEKDYELVYSDYVKSNFKLAEAKAEESTSEVVKETKEATIEEKEEASAVAPVVNSTEVKTFSAEDQKVEEKKMNEENQVFKAQKLVKNKELSNPNHKPRVRESITIAIWLVIIFYSLSLVNIGRKE